MMSYFSSCVKTLVLLLYSSLSLSRFLTTSSSLCSTHVLHCTVVFKTFRDFLLQKRLIYVLRNLISERFKFIKLFRFINRFNSRLNVNHDLQKLLFSLFTLQFKRSIESFYRHEC